MIDRNDTFSASHRSINVNDSGIVNHLHLAHKTLCTIYCSRAMTSNMNVLRLSGATTGRKNNSPQAVLIQNRCDGAFAIVNLLDFNAVMLRVIG